VAFFALIHGLRKWFFMTSLANVKKLQRDIINTLTNPEAAYYSLKIVSISIIQQLCQI